LGGDLPVIGATTRAELAACTERARPAIVFLDLALPGLGGLDGVPTVRSLIPDAKVVVLAGAPNEQDAVVALVAGARGYCGRDIEPRLMRKAAQVVQRGEVWIGRHVISYLLRELATLTGAASKTPATPAPVAALDLLAPREREIAVLVGSGRTNS